MPAFVVLLRAVNVGGRYYRMADLRRHLEDSGLTEVETHIQTGNVRFRSAMRSPARVEAHVERVLGEHCGFDVPAVVLTPAELRAVHEDALALPLPPFVAEGPVRRYVSFFKPGDVPAGEAAERIAAWESPGEAAAVVGRAVHLTLLLSFHDARFLRTFKRPLAPGTVRDLTVVTAMAAKWGRVVRSSGGQGGVTI